MRRWLVVVMAAAMVALSGCGAVREVVPGAEAGGSDTYRIHIEFANVLNLPSGAPVMANGVNVGRLAGVRIDQRGFVVADADIDNGIPIPVTTTAMLRQSAPLADVHIVLDSEVSNSVAAPRQATLPAGGTIPIRQTAESPQIEDTLAGLATAVGNGTFHNMITTVRELNRAFPDDTEQTAHTFGVIGKNLDDLAANQKSIRSMVNGLTDTVDGVIRDKEILGPLLEREGVQHTTEAMGSIVGILFILTDLGQIAPPARWLVPLVGAMSGTVRAVVPTLFGSNPLDTTVPSNMRKLTDLLENDLIPFVASGAKVDVTKVTLGSGGRVLTGADQSEQIVRLMRMIGLVR